MADAAQPRRQQTPASTEPDLDKVEAAFIDGFIDAPDPVSFLRLGRIPFEMTAADGAKLNLLRVEIDALADVGSLTPHLGGGVVPLRSAAGEHGFASPALALRLFRRRKPAPADLCRGARTLKSANCKPQRMPRALQRHDGAVADSRRPHAQTRPPRSILSGMFPYGSSFTMAGSQALPNLLYGIINLPMVRTNGRREARCPN